MSHPGTIQYLREFIKKELAGLYPEREIEAITGVLCLYRLDLKRHEVGLRKHEILMPPDREWFERAIKKLKSGTPVQHITGETHFLDLKLKVTPSALIPRPETEELVQWILEDLQGSRSIEKQPANETGPLRIWDIGTGTGCIALALASNLPGSKIYASDISEEALKLARENSRSLKLEVEFFQHDITSDDPPPLPADLDIIVSNPPYIPLREKETINLNVRDQDPDMALFVPDSNPLLFYSHIANCEFLKLQKGGMLYLEIHENFGEKVCLLLEEKGFIEVALRKDIHGKDRMVRARNSKPSKLQNE